MEEEIKILKKDQKACISSFESIILSENRNTEIMQKCLQGNADRYNIRPTSWKLFLDNLPKDSSIPQWVETVSKQRAEYKQKKTKFLSAKKLAGDPLGANSKQITNTNEPGWNSFFGDKDIKALINKDIARLYQEIDLFHQNATILTLSNVLFIWAKENTDLSYKQGMHDLLALIYLAFYPYYAKKVASSNPSKEELIKYATENSQKYSSELYQFFHDEDEMQSDLYFAFASLMKRGMKDLYISTTNNTPEERNKVISQYQLFNSDWLDTNDKDIPTPIYIRLTLLVKEKLRAVDDELCCHFKYIKLDTAVILQRYVKCIFLREFNYTDCFLIWDTIFANQESDDKYGLMFIDYLVISMMLRIRDQLLKGDGNDCLMLMNKYPHVDNLLELVGIAERVKRAINDKLNGKQIRLSDVLPIVLPKVESKIETQPKPTTTANPSVPVSNQYTNITNSFSTQSQSHQSNYNPIQKSTSQGMSQFISEPNPEPETNQMKSLFNNAWSSVGGFVTDIKSQVTKQIEKVITEDKFNLRLPQSQAQSSSSYPVNISQPSEAIKILEKIYSKYQLKMEQNDQADFAAAIEYFKNKQ